MNPVAEHASGLIYGFVGLGLMGGSFAKAVRTQILNQPGSRGDILACDARPDSLRQSEQDGIISEGFPPDKAGDMLSRCDVVFICLYPRATLEFLQLYRDAFKSGSVVTDISGVKTELLSSLPDCLRKDVDFISENTPEHLEFFKNLVTSIGFRRIIETDAVIHDHKIAFTSQLCHVIAAALVDSAEDTGITAFGGGSFEDLTRIAMINAPLWTELFFANRKELLYHLDSFEQSLQQLRDCLENGDRDKMQQFLEQVRIKRTDMSRIEQP